MKVSLITLMLFGTLCSIAQTNANLGTSSGTGGSYNATIGYYAGNVSTGTMNVIVGAQAGQANTTASGNVFLGYASGNANTTGGDNTFLGRGTGFVNTTGQFNTYGGAYSGRWSTTANYNTGYGRGALVNTSTGSSNSSLGYQALQTNTTGSNNTAIGYLADVSSAALTNATAIGNGAIVTTSNAIQLGNSAVTQVQVGTGNTATLIAGGLKVTGGTLGAGKVLTSDANGVATWQTPSGGSGGSSQWATSPNGLDISYSTGNVGIGTSTPYNSQGWDKVLDVSGATNSKILATASGQTYRVGMFAHSSWNGGGGFIGTETNHKLFFITNYTSPPSMTLDVNGNVGIGTTQPDYKLTVNGTIHSTEVKVTATVPAPDYVFEKDYNLQSLDEIKTYIDQNKHLPEVPSAKEMEKNGIQLSEMSLLLLKKVEELTLHLIEMKKENEQLKSRVQSLEHSK